MAAPPVPYESWSKQDLIARLRSLEEAVRPTRSPPTSLDTTEGTATVTTTVTTTKTSSLPRKQKPFNFAAYPRRKIALKFCYVGSEFNGLEFQRTPTPLPTVEGVLWDALVHTKLVDPEGGFDGCGWEKCGRTDKGVSAAGQVVSFWARSATGDPSAEAINSVGATDKELHEEQETQNEQVTPSISAEETSNAEGELDLMGSWDEPPSNTGINSPPASSLLPPAAHGSTPPPQELKYVSTINAVLPPSIRVLAYAFVAPTFSARFNCLYRHYKYFFTDDGLDISTMREGAQRLVGEHDFRNLCKVDPTKQLVSFRRRILSADISLVEAAADEAASNYVLTGEPGQLQTTGKRKGRMWVLDLVGTAFLYNQVRHIMAILFLIGTRLEPPSLVSALLNVGTSSSEAGPGEENLDVVSCKPEYQMADALPLMLWDSGYREEDVRWRTDNSDPSASVSGGLSQKEAANNVYAQLHSQHTRSRIRAALDGHFLRQAARYHPPPPEHFPLPLAPVSATSEPSEPDSSLSVHEHAHAQRLQAMRQGALGVLSVPLGGGTFRRGARYVRVLERKRSEAVEVVNERWRVGKGRRRAEKADREDENVKEEENGDE